MKVLALVAALCSSLVVAASANASVETVNFGRVVINGKEAPRHVGILTMDYSAKKVSLVIVDDICGNYTPAKPGEYRCMAMPMPVETIELPMADAKRDGCGSLIYNISRDMRPVDGPRYDLQIVDHRHRLCEDVIPSVWVAQARVTLPRGGFNTYFLSQK